MAYPRTRKHYRVAQKKVAHSPERGVFITNNMKSKFIAAGIALLIVVFIKGIVIGYLCGRDND